MKTVEDDMTEAQNNAKKKVSECRNKSYLFFLQIYDKHSDKFWNI
jgi:hypothetical protein